MRKNKNREQVRIAVESVRGGARCLWRMRIEKQKIWANAHETRGSL